MTDNPDRRPPGPPRYRPRPASALTLRRGPPPRSAAAEAEAALDTPPPFRLRFLSPALSRLRPHHMLTAEGVWGTTPGGPRVRNAALSRVISVHFSRLRSLFLHRHKMAPAPAAPAPKMSVFPTAASCEMS